MGVRIEWHDAAHVSTSVYPPGNDDWVGSNDQGDDWVLTVSTNDVCAIHGTREQLLAIATEITRAVESATPEGGTP